MNPPKPKCEWFDGDVSMFTSYNTSEWQVLLMSSPRNSTKPYCYAPGWGWGGVMTTKDVQ